MCLFLQIQYPRSARGSLLCSVLKIIYITHAHTKQLLQVYCEHEGVQELFYDKRALFMPDFICFLQNKWKLVDNRNSGIVPT